MIVHDSAQNIKVAPKTVDQQLEQLYQLVAPTWPLASTVACNPLQGLESLPFAEATRRGQQLFDAHCLPGFWQIRHARQQGFIQAGDFREALRNVADELPETLQLEDRTISTSDLLTALLEELDDRTEITTTSTLLDQVSHLLVAQRPWQNHIEPINREMITWLATFLDEGQAAWGMPFRKAGFFKAVKTLLQHDRKGSVQRSLLNKLPADSRQAIAFLMESLSIPAADRKEFLRDHLLALPGWAAYIRWRSDQHDYEPQQQHPISLDNYLAVRLMIAATALPAKTTDTPFVPRELVQLNNWAEAYLQPTSSADPKNWATILTLLQKAYHNLRLKLLQCWETEFRKMLGEQIQSQAQQRAPLHRPAAQLAFCIDVRSEPFRRHVEAAGNYETFGFAGFFGLPIAYHTLLGKRVKSLPVLLQPAHELREDTGAGCEQLGQRYAQGRGLLNELKATYKSLKYNLATSFAAAEALGLPAGLITIGRSLIPRTLNRWRQAGRKLFYPPIDLAPDVHAHGDWGIPFDQQVIYAGNALRMMGLTTNFAPLVVLCGHGSQTENNPYAAALDCGACGGSHGGPNAAAMARILNQHAIRERLRAEGIAIPNDTLFIGAQHNTTTDAITLIDLGELNEEKNQQVDQLRTDLAKAQQANLDARAPQLGAPNGDDLLRRSADWSEVRPEWGLAGNAGFVVAPRHLTAKLDLRGRCFLHSYDWEQDPDAASLEVIMTAPLVVAQWINSQYFFSTTDNVAFGSGSKITHNVVGKVGIMQGNGSDLMHGLPLQSVMRNDQELYHQPLRLTALVVAPRNRVQMLIERHAILQKLFYNEWVTIQIWDPEREVMERLLPGGAWVEA